MGGKLTFRQFLVPFILFLIGAVFVFAITGLDPLKGLLDTAPKVSSTDLRSKAEIDESLRNFENQTQPAPSAEVIQPEPVVKAAPREIAKPKTGPTEAELLALRDIQERLAAEDARRRERNLAAQQAPLGESIHSIADIRNKKTAAKQQPVEQLVAQPKVIDGLNRLVSGTADLEEARGSGNFLSAGSIIPAALITEIRSELPGLVKAQVTEDVFDTVTGYNLLIPRGSTLLGSYGQNTSAGQSRLFVYWTRLMYPDGRILNLGQTGSVDAKGASGLIGKRQTGFLSSLLGATLINLAQSAGQTNTTPSDLAQVAQAAAGAGVGTVTSRYLEERFTRGPRFTIKAGTIANVMLETDFKLPKWTRQ